MTRKTAFVTGASRGIGKSCAIELAKAGFDVAITARTVHAGEAREHSPTVRYSDTTPLPGSLEETAAEVEKAGGKALMVPADILDPASLGQAAMTVIERWGGVDCVVHVARHIGVGHMDKFMDTPIEALENHMQGNVIATFRLNKFFIPSMMKRGGGTIMNFTSASGYGTPQKPAGEGGWGMCYGYSKAAIHRSTGILALELKPHHIHVFNVDPGYTETERIAQDMAKFGFSTAGAAPAGASGATVAWLATKKEAAKLSGQTVWAQYFAYDRKLYKPGTWRPYVGDIGPIFDPAPATLERIENAERAKRKAEAAKMKAKSRTSRVSKAKARPAPKKNAAKKKPAKKK